MKCIKVLNVQYGVVHKTLFVYYMNVLFYNKDKYVQNQFYRADTRVAIFRVSEARELIGFWHLRNEAETFEKKSKKVFFVKKRKKSCQFLF